MTFYDEMRHLLTDRDRRLALASRGRQFVETVHDADLAARTLQTAYLAPRANEVRRGMPDWASLSRARRIEVLESAVDRLQAELRRSRLREAALRQQLELPDRAESRARRMVRSAVPYDVRARLLRAVGRR